VDFSVIQKIRNGGICEKHCSTDINVWSDKYLQYTSASIKRIVPRTAVKKFAMDDACSSVAACAVCMPQKKTLLTLMTLPAIK